MKLALKKKACQVRMGVIESTHGAKAGHPGGSLSAADLFAYLRSRLQTSGLMPGKRAQFQRHVPPHRLSERASPPVIQNFDPRDVPSKS